MKSKIVTTTPALAITLPCSDTELSFGLEVLISHSPTSAYHEFDMGCSCFFTFLFGVSKNIQHKSSEQHRSYERTWCFSYWSLQHNSLTAQDCMPAMLREMITKYSLLKWYQIKYTYHINRDKLRHKSTFLQNTSGNSTLRNCVWKWVLSNDYWHSVSGSHWQVNGQGKALSVHIVKAYGGSRGVTPLFLKLGTTCRWTVSLTFWPAWVPTYLPTYLPTHPHTYIYIYVAN